MTDQSSSIRRSSIWELDQRPEPQYGRAPDGTPMRLVTIVDRDSHFVVIMKVELETTPNHARDALAEGIKNRGMIPRALLVKDEQLVRELTPVAQEYDFELKVVKKFEVIPQIMRELTQMIGRQPVTFVPDSDQAPEDMLFDDCEICRAQKAALLDGREPTFDEMKKAFKKAKNSGKGIVGGDMEL